MLPINDLRQQSPIVAFSLWKTCGKLWRTCGEGVEKRWTGCGNDVEFLGKINRLDKFCKIFEPFRILSEQTNSFEFRSLGYNRKPLERLAYRRSNRQHNNQAWTLIHRWTATMSKPLLQFWSYLPPVKGVPQNSQFSLLKGDRHFLINADSSCWRGRVSVGASDQKPILTATSRWWLRCAEI